MNTEALSQILDASAFVLVTPEFLGESRLSRFRGHVEDPIVFIVSRLFLSMDSARPIRHRLSDQSSTGELLKDLKGIFIFNLIGTIILIAGFYFTSFPWNWTGLLGVILGIINAILFVLLTVSVFFTVMTAAAAFLLAIERMGVRGALFLVGSGAFFYTRAMLFINSP
jgi:hypothetical protein